MNEVEGLYTVSDLIKGNTLSSDMAALDWYLVENRVSILVAGDGKTTTLNYLANFIKPGAKITTIETRPKLQLYQENWIQAVTRSERLGDPYGAITKLDLLKSTMKKKPDCIIIDDLSGEETFNFFQVMATGYTGLATICARDEVGVINTLEKEANVPRALIPSVELIKIQNRKNGSLESLKNPPIRTVITTEIVGLEPAPINELLTNAIYRWDSEKDRYEFSGRSTLLERIAERTGMPLEKVHEELGIRKTVLEWMVESGIREYPEVVDVIQDFYTDPEGVFKKARGTSL